MSISAPTPAPSVIRASASDLPAFLVGARVTQFAGDDRKNLHRPVIGLVAIVIVAILAVQISAAADRFATRSKLQSTTWTSIGQLEEFASQHHDLASDPAYLSAHKRLVDEEHHRRVAEAESVVLRCLEDESGQSSAGRFECLQAHIDLIETPYLHQQVTAEIERLTLTLETEKYETLIAEANALFQSKDYASAQSRAREAESYALSDSELAAVADLEAKCDREIQRLAAALESKRSAVQRQFEGYCRRRTSSAIDDSIRIENILAGKGFVVIDEGFKGSPPYGTEPFIKWGGTVEYQGAKFWVTVLNAMSTDYTLVTAVTVTPSP